eukprot:838387_1
MMKNRIWLTSVTFAWILWLSCTSHFQGAHEALPSSLPHDSLICSIHNDADVVETDIRMEYQRPQNNVDPDSSITHYIASVMALVAIGAFTISPQGTVDYAFVYPGATMAFSFLFNGARSQYTPWTLGDTAFSSTSYAHAAGYDDYSERIWLMGGIYGYYKRLMSFNVTSHEFIDHGNLLPIDVSEFRTMSFYSQLNNIVYISGDSIAIHNFNVLTQDMQTNIAAIPSTPYDEQCLVAFSMDYDYFIVAGGYNSGNSAAVYAYNITGGAWLASVPSLPYGRSNHACVVVDQTIYVIGGYQTIVNHYMPLHDTDNMFNSGWTELASYVTTTRGYTNAIVWGHDILLLGGYGGSGAGGSFDVINTMTGAVYNGGALNYSLRRAVPVIVYPDIFILGAEADNSAYDTNWQYHHLNSEPLNDYMYPINIYPQPSFSRSDFVNKTVNVRSWIQSTGHNITYYARFNILYQDCHNPTLTIYYQDTDFGVDGSASKFLHVYYEGTMIATCGSNVNTCNDYKYCLQNHNLSLNSIPMDTQFTVVLVKGKDSGVPSSCDYSLWADVTLRCFVPPTVTAAPSMAPSFAPYNPWRLGDTTFPSGSYYYHAAGYDDYSERVWLMGGIYQYYRRLMSFNVTSHAFINHGNVLPIDVSESRTLSFYSQLNNIVYIRGDSLAIHSFNVLSQQMQTNIATIPAPLYDEQCLVAFSTDSDYLIVAAGYSGGNSPAVYGYNITGGVWLPGVPWLPGGRSNHACVVVDQKMFVIGGYQTIVNYYMPIHDMHNILNSGWTQLASYVTTTRGYTNAIVWGHDILLLGGYGGSGAGGSFDVINTMTGSVYNGGALNYSLRRAVPVIVYPDIFILGAEADNSAYDTNWQYHHLNSEPLNDYMYPI